MNKIFTKKNAFAFIAIANLIVLVLYFALRQKEQYIVILDAFVVGLQVAANLLMGLIFLIVDKVRKPQNMMEVLDEDENLLPQNDHKIKLTKPFLLSALLVLLIGFGLCILKNQ
jgi:hypothetical protein